MYSMCGKYCRHSVYFWQKVLQQMRHYGPSSMCTILQHQQQKGELLLSMNICKGFISLAQLTRLKMNSPFLPIQYRSVIAEPHFGIFTHFPTPSGLMALQINLGVTQTRFDLDSNNSFTILKKLLEYVPSIEDSYNKEIQVSKTDQVR